MFQNMSNNQNMKTKLCWSVNSLGPCPYGNRCTFAHNINEIVCKECNFGDWCNLIMFTEDGSENCGDKVCKFKHPSETKEMYLKRLNINIHHSSESTHTRYQTNICAPVKKLDWNIQDNKIN